MITHKIQYASDRRTEILFYDDADGVIGNASIWKVSTGFTLSIQKILPYTHKRTTNPDWHPTRYGFGRVVLSELPLFDNLENSISTAVKIAPLYIL